MYICIFNHSLSFEKLQCGNISNTYWNPVCSFAAGLFRLTFSKGLYTPGPGYGAGDCIIFLSVVDLNGAVAIFGESLRSLSFMV